LGQLPEAMQVVDASLKLIEEGIVKSY
jgi:stress-induced-phosphoprotein 1